MYLLGLLPLLPLLLQHQRCLLPGRNHFFKKRLNHQLLHQRRGEIHERQQVKNGVRTDNVLCAGCNGSRGLDQSIHHMLRVPASVRVVRGEFLHGRQVFRSVFCFRLGIQSIIGGLERGGGIRRNLSAVEAGVHGDDLAGGSKIEWVSEGGISVLEDFPSSFYFPLLLFCLLPLPVFSP